MALPWKLHGDGKNVPASEIVLPEERLTWPRTIGLGAQHVVAMFGATFLVPLLTGFPPSTTLLFSGIGTMLFLLITRNRVPSYLGSSFAFIAPILAAVASDGQGVALAGIIVVGALLAVVGLIVNLAGTRWINLLMPPVVAGTIVALIGFNLAPAAKNNFEASPLVASVTLLTVIVVAVAFKGMVGRLSILIGVVVGYIVAAFMDQVDLAGFDEAAWIGLPTFTAPVFAVEHLLVYLMFVPVVLALIAENVGHVKGVGQLTNRNLDPMAGRALLADGLATVLSGFGGGSPTTTYGENIGVMSATRVYSTAAYWVAAIAAILLALSPKVGVLIASVPAGVLGGITTALYGLIGIIGVRIWLENKVDFSSPTNQFTAGVGLIVAIGDFTINSGQVTFGGIVLGTVATLVVYHLMSGIAKLRGSDAEDAGEDLVAGADGAADAERAAR
ncbi:NCS2 family nucleobase:cation symporter-2 [Pseudoclavibacter sp. JAI123]|uniref:uracil-xanthine permease family protein n=1 Tax=Pseudoclavibacter sp. JAI123 TaxID=2723065 RepID=UPI0015C75FE3|nr:solute carrier family 23 protein [Pseudoclavibacter sp. JAI123]NYF12632.1 NCS2 family nucleobase:cation symporter-2 [Pseudoclavibacter sp. JAI123]